MLYVAADRYDIMYSVRVLAQAISKPRAIDERRLKHLLKYLKGTIDGGWRYHYQDTPAEVQGFGDSDLGGGSEDAQVGERRLPDLRIPRVGVLLLGAAGGGPQQRSHVTVPPHFLRSTTTTSASTSALSLCASAAAREPDECEAALHALPSLTTQRGWRWPS